METAELQSDILMELSGSYPLRHVVSCLKGWGCCVRCQLRFLGIKETSAYRGDVQDVSDRMDALLKKQDALEGNSLDDQVKEPLMPPVVENEMKVDTDGAKEVAMETSVNGGDVKSDNVCAVCLGILQDKFCDENFRVRVCNFVKDEKFQYDTFFCALSLPVTTLLREHSLYVCLKELVPEVFTENRKDAMTRLKDVWKWVNGPRVSTLLGVSFDQKSPFEVSINFTHENIMSECGFLYELYPDTFKKRKKNTHGWVVFTRANVIQAIKKTADYKFKSSYYCPPKPVTNSCECDSITCLHEAIFVAGRYNKYSRFLSQTPWVIDGKRKSESSIEELICGPLRQQIPMKESRFSSSGREDVDVRMLGNGRPFVVEVVNPRKHRFTAEQMTATQRSINEASADVRVRDLQIVSREDTNNLKEGEMEKVKHYLAYCCINRPITQGELDEALKDIKDLILYQKTPMRVLHRRPLAVREKVIHSISGVVNDDRHFTLTLSSMAGTYIKEFVHGDFGRTTPNMGTILNAECDILSLDVKAVDLNWPKHIDDDEAEQTEPDIKYSQNVGQTVT